VCCVCVCVCVFVCFIVFVATVIIILINKRLIYVLAFLLGTIQRVVNENLSNNIATFENGLF